MTNLRHLREFVSIAREHNLTNDKDTTLVALTDDMEFVRWMKRHDAINAFAKLHQDDGVLATEVYDEAINDKYLLPHDTLLPSQDLYLKVTPAGKRFIKTWWIFPTGLWRRWADDNKSLTTLAISFSSGVVIGAAGIILTLVGIK